MNDADLSPYEQQQLEQLRRWRSRAPGWLTRGFAQASGPATRLAQQLVPVSALRFALDKSNTLAERMTDTEAVLRSAGVHALGELRSADLEQCDALAERIRRQSVRLSAVGGAIAGVAGAPGLVLDVPALLTLSLHTIHRTGLCYGYESLGPPTQAYAIGVFALASANTMEEKELALSALQRYDTPADAAVRDGMERAAQRELSKGAAIFSLHNLARQLGLNLTRRKAAAVVPVLGAVVGGAINAWYLHDLAQTARYAFHARRFTDRGIFP